MAERKFPNKPWHDNHSHAGFHSHEMRKQASEAELQEWLTSLHTLTLVNELTRKPSSLINEGTIVYSVGVSGVDDA
jgi:hypothetical protein